MAGLVSEAFSLTPTLSRWERERRFQRLGKAKAGFSSQASAFYETGQRLFLLPAGEGQDEGENNLTERAAMFLIKSL
mgnify:CR=1 FL=1